MGLVYGESFEMEEAKRRKEGRLNVKKACDEQMAVLRISLNIYPISP